VDWIHEDKCECCNTVLSSIKDVEFPGWRRDYLFLIEDFSGEFVGYVVANTCALQAVIPLLFYT
jgi:hypothetical protein